VEFVSHAIGDEAGNSFEKLAGSVEWQPDVVVAAIASVDRSAAEFPFHPIPNDMNLFERVSFGMEESRSLSEVPVVAVPPSQPSIADLIEPLQSDGFSAASNGDLGDLSDAWEAWGSHANAGSPKPHVSSPNDDGRQFA
jgi:hypothetical protein